MSSRNLHGASRGGNHTRDPVARTFASLSLASTLPARSLPTIAPGTKDHWVTAIPTASPVAAAAGASPTKSAILFPTPSKNPALVVSPSPSPSLSLSLSPLSGKPRTSQAKPKPKPTAPATATPLPPASTASPDPATPTPGSAPPPESATPRAGRFGFRDDQEFDLLMTFFNGPDSWTTGLTLRQQYEWLVDCYRLHATEHTTGVYDAPPLPNATDRIAVAEALAADFLRFCVLAKRRGVTGWGGTGVWKEFLECARPVLPEGLGEEEAWRKHGDEALFVGKTRCGRSLPFTARLVQECPMGHFVHAQKRAGDADRKGAEGSGGEALAEEAARMLWEARCGMCGACKECRRVFWEVGGARVWREFRDDLVMDMARGRPSVMGRTGSGGVAVGGGGKTRRAGEGAMASSFESI
ncbi:hypothetical protein HDU96_010317 [Phlyctochytrium bullatum]|nr:hypothetical protein HDU96_010317 [Phlyctochytrium bullatum]